VGAVFLVNRKSLDFPPDRKVLKAEEYLAWVEANNIIESARQEGEKIIAEARAVFEAEKKRGYEAGLEQGKGVIAERMLQTVKKTIDYFASAEETLCTLVMSALRKIIGEMDDRELILRVIRNGLALVRTQKQVVLKVSPADLDAVQREINTILADFPGIGFIDVIADSRLKKSDCILECDIGVIDAGLDTQLQAIKRSLLKSIKK